jgi:maltose alpha-D-glucosyltransferase/alpha-amylase
MAKRPSGDGLILTGRNWWEHGTALEIRPDAFYDARGTGIGNFKGITEKLPFIKWMGYKVIWLTPFLKSPRKDGGYDVSDFRAVDPTYGTLEDLKELVREAHRLGLKVIMDWVPCHTSDQHPWFQSSRTNPRGPHGDYYIWSEKGDEDVLYIDADGQYKDVRNILADDPEPRTVLANLGRKRRRTPARCWGWDNVRRQWYWHRFYPFQPALNYDNPEVEEANLGNMLFWVEEVGIDGFRVDAVPFLYKKKGTSHEDVEEVHDWVRRTKQALRERFPHIMLLCESDLPEEQIRTYQTPDQFDSAFDFRLRVALYLAFALRDASPLLHLLLSRFPLLFGVSNMKHKSNHDDLRAQWAQWVLTVQKILEILREFYADGVRGEPFLGDAVVGNFAQMFKWNMGLMKLFHFIQMSFPGMQLDYYADIIGMGHHPELARGEGPTGDGREGVRTPMQWTAGRNAGFSQAGPGRLYLPVINSGRGAYPLVNVESQVGDPESWLSHNRQAIALTNNQPLLGFGLVRPLLGHGLPEPGSSEKIQQFGIARWLDGYDRALVSLFNLSDKAALFTTELPDQFIRFRNSALVDTLGGARIGRLNGLKLELLLPPEGCYVAEIRWGN